MENKCGENVPFTENPQPFMPQPATYYTKPEKNRNTRSTSIPSCTSLQNGGKQLYGESEGKDHLGIYPASVDFTTDLHPYGGNGYKTENARFSKRFFP